MEKLKPCPFCGCMALELSETERDLAYTISCKICKMQAKTFVDKESVAELAVKKWNRQAVYSEPSWARQEEVLR